jgi:hypothetical protein
MTYEDDMLITKAAREICSNQAAKSDTNGAACYTQGRWDHTVWMRLVEQGIRRGLEGQTDALKMARDAIRGLLDITSEYNLDSEQAGRAYAALHEIGTALAALKQSK